MNRFVILALCIGLLGSLAWAEDDPRFESRAQIRLWIEERKGFDPSPEFVDLAHGVHQFYIAYFIPTSGLNFCHVYTFRAADNVWRLARHSALPDGCDMEIHFDPEFQNILYMDADGDELDRLKL